MTDDPAFLSATRLLALYRRKKLSPVEATRAALAQIERFETVLNAFVLVDEKKALAAARASERRWWKGEPKGAIDGVPTTLKDTLLAQGWPTLRGSRTIDAKGPWTEDAPTVARLREAGAVFLGKTTTPEFGWKAVTDSTLTGVTRNPWDLERTPGGSSGGAAASLAVGAGTLAVGTDGGGSVRIPAGFTGVVGFKPTVGLVPIYPGSATGNLGHVGPMARNVADAALVLDVIAQPDIRDWQPPASRPQSFTKNLGQGIEGLRVAFSANLGYAKVDPEIAAIVARAARTFTDLGARLSHADPGFPAPDEIFRLHWYPAAAWTVHSIPKAKRRLVDPGLAHIAAEGQSITLVQHYAAAAERIRLAQTMRRFHERFDILLTPTLPIAAFAAGVDGPGNPKPGRWADWTPFTFPFNLTGQPAISVPCGLTEGGLPVGLQIIGPIHRDDLVLRAAHAFEQARPFSIFGANRAGGE